MTNTKTHSEADSQTQASVSTEGEVEATEATAADEVSAENDPAVVLERLQGENDDLKDRLLRALADMENLRRRSERELNDARSYAIARFAGDLLNVADNLARALASVPEDAGETTRVIKEGIELTEKEMLRTLEKHGVKKLEPNGERFDPNFHQAMFEVPDPSVPNGTVAQVVQVGYSIGSRVLRPALVGVARGGPKATVAEADNLA